MTGKHDEPGLRGSVGTVPQGDIESSRPHEAIRQAIRLGLHDFKDDFEHRNTEEVSFFDMSWVWSFVAELRRHFRLLAALIAVFLVVGIALYISKTPVYTAVAIIGPPGPSPTNAMMAGMTSGGATSVARRLIGGGTGSGGNDPYQEYLQLLPSSPPENPPPRSCRLRKCLRLRARSPPPRGIHRSR